MSRSESKALRDARTRLSTAQTTLSQATSKKTTLEKDLSTSAGPSDVFRTLKGQCVALDSGEYTYELCWLETVRQKSNKGGGQQSMGSFERFDVETTDDDLPADGRGLGAGRRTVMKFSGGTHCWNGPDRSTSVVLGCADKEEIWRVAEEEKCVYRMEVGTPAVCVDDEAEAEASAGAGGAQGGKAGVKEEL